MKKLIIIGAGGHAMSVFDSIINYKVVGFVDEKLNGYFLNDKKYKIYSSIKRIPNYKDMYYHIAIGDCKVREKYYKIIKDNKLKLATIIHPSAIVSKYAKIGKGNYIGRQAIINVNVEIGENNIINSNALIEHGCVIGNNCNISTCAVLNGDVIIKDSCFIGSNSVCKGQIKVEEHTIVGCGAVCISNVEPFTTVVGCPARKIMVKDE